MASKEKKKNGLEIYKSKDEFRWRIYRQGRIIAASTEGYKRLNGVIRNLYSVLQSFDIVSAYADFKLSRKKK